MKRHLLYTAGKQVVKLYGKLLLDLDIQFNRHLPDGAKIIAINHPTTLDPFVSVAVIPQRVHILVTESAFKVPLFGAYLRRSGHIPVITGSGRSAFDAALDLLRAGETLLVAPEGALSTAEHVPAHPHTGTVRLALLAGVPIVPMGIALDWSRIKFIDTGIRNALGEPEIARVYARGPYAVTVGAPVQMRGSVEEREQVVQQTEALMARIMRLSRESAARISSTQAAPVNMHDTAEFPGI